MGGTGSSVNTNTTSPTDAQLMRSISDLHNNKMNLVETSSINNEELSRFRRQLAKTGQLGGSKLSFMPPANKYKHYDIAPYLENINRASSMIGGAVDVGNNGFEELSELEGIDELRKIIESIENEPFQPNKSNQQHQTGGDYLDTSPISEGIKHAFQYSMNGGGYNELNELESIVEDDFDDEMVTDEEYLAKDNAFSETSVFSDSNEFTVSSIQEAGNSSEMSEGIADINVLPFYSSTESSSFQHPYAKNRFE